MDALDRFRLSRSRSGNGDFPYYFSALLSSDSTMQGWIDDVHEGVVYGRFVQPNGRLVEDRLREFEFSVPILDIIEDQRVDLEPGRYVSFVNGYLLIDKTIWTTHDMETADREADRLFRRFARS